MVRDGDFDDIRVEGGGEQPAIVQDARHVATLSFGKCSHKIFVCPSPSAILQSIYPLVRRRLCLAYTLLCFAPSLRMTIATTVFFILISLKASPVDRDS